MSEAFDFTSILDTKGGTSKAPPSCPAGMYLMQVDGYELGARKNREDVVNPYCEVTMTYREAMEGVDLDELAERGVDLSKKKLREKFYLTDAALFMLNHHETGFLVKLGLAVDGRDLRDILPEMQGQEIKALIVETPSADGERTYNNVQKFLSVD